MEKFNLDKAELILKDIVSKEFTKNDDYEKRQVRRRGSYFSCACPICGDSNKNKSAKRGTLYYNTLLYRCFNCDYTSTLLSLSKTFDVNMEIDTKMSMVDYVSDSFNRNSFRETEFLSNELNKIIDVKDLENYFNNNDESPFSSFMPIEKGSPAYKYLISRKIFNHDMFYEATHWLTDSWREPVIINMNMNSEGKVLGLQTRNLTSNKKYRRYRIFKFSELYSYINPDNTLDEIEEIGYNKLSYLYNILNVDFDKPVTIFEGFMDTHFFPNSIGMVGKNTDPSILYDKDYILRFFFDYDKAGIKKAIEYIEQGHSVFLWEKMFKIWTSKFMENTRAYRKITNTITDLNDIAIKMNNPYKKLKMEKYFSIDEFDKYYIKDL